MKTLLCAIGKQENHYIREWVEHYKAIGFTNIVLYDNNDIDGERFEEVIGDYINDGFVILENVRGRQQMQHPCYEHCYRKYGNDYDWIAFFDCDEYLDIDDGRSVSDVLSMPIYDGKQTIVVCWKNFDDNDLVWINGEYSLRKRFTRIIQNPRLENRIVKAFIRGGISTVTFEKDLLGGYGRQIHCNTRGEIVSNTSFVLPETTWDNMYLSHYRFKTMEEYVQKVIRGYADRSMEESRKWMNMDNFFTYNIRTKEKEDCFKKLMAMTDEKKINGKYAFCLIIDNNYMEGGKTLIYSFLKNNPWFDGDIVVMCSDSVYSLNETNRNILKSLSDRIVFHNIDEAKYLKAIEHFKGKTGLPQFATNCIKLDVFGLTQYDKLILADADMVITGSLYDVYNTDESYYIAASRNNFTDMWTEDFLDYKDKKDDNFNIGLLFINKKGLNEDIRKELTEMAETFEFGKDEYCDGRLAEQDVINYYFRDKKVRILPSTYNAPKLRFTNGQRVVTNEKVIHYWFAKPWNSDEAQYRYINSIWHQYNNEMNSIYGKKDMKVLLIGIAKQENRYLREWVTYNKAVGFDNIVLCDNNDEDGERFEEVIKDYIDDGFVIVEDWRGKKNCQYPAYKECYEKYKDSYDWVGFFDLDEFITFTSSTDIKKYLGQSKFNNFAEIHINWLCYGDNDVVADDGSQGVFTRFTKPVEPYDFKKTYDFPENFHTKVFLRGGIENVTFPTAHNPQVGNLKVCNAVGAELDKNTPFVPYDYSEIFIRHFATKTIWEYIGKIKKGDVIRQLTEADRIDWARKFFAYNKVTKEKIDIIKQELGYDLSDLLPYKPYEGEKSKDIQIFSLCYSKKNFAFINNKYITPLQVGAANGTDVCELKDNTGDNISNGNSFFIENTGTYWIWKNVNDAKYKGQMQYRRPLEGIDENTDFEAIFKDYDVITCEPFNHPSHKLPTKEEPMVIPADTVEEGYAFSNCLDDLLILEMVVKMYFPDYAEDWDKYIKKGENLYYSNGFIMKAEDYNRYSEFLFACLNGYLNMANIHNQNELMDHVKYNLEVGKYIRYKDRKYTDGDVKWQSEIGGFLSERIWTLWLQHNYPQERIYKKPYIKQEEGMYT